MSTVSNIKNLLQRQDIWQASDKNKVRSVLSTGYLALDNQLHYSGWPKGALSELLLSDNGIGEIRLLSPLLARLNQQPGHVCWINPPFIPYAPALTNQSIDLNKMVIVRSRSLPQTIWSAQQAMVSQACAAVLVWLPQKILSTEIRKLSLAAKTGKCWGFIFRAHSLQDQSSAAVLRIIMQIKQRKNLLSIIKQPGGWAGQQVNLDLFPERVNWNPLSVNHWPVFTPKSLPQNRHQQNDHRLEKTDLIHTPYPLPPIPASPQSSESQLTMSSYH